MTKITIPPQALEAGRKAFTEAMLTVPQPDPIRAAFEAIVGAWPGVWTGPMELGEGNMLILPLPTEPRDE